MTTSNSTNFSMNANDIISDALRLIGVLGAGETVDGDDYSLSLRQLNMMVKTWMVEGVKLWTETEGTVFLDSGKASYILGSSSADESTSSELKTELSVALAATNTAVTVDSTTGMTAADIIGIAQDDGTMHWTTISTVDSSTTLTLASGIVSASSIDQHVYTYTTLMVKPLDISSVRVENSGGSATALSKMSRDDYFKLNNKSSVGLPRSFYYDRQRDNGKLYTYPITDDAMNRLRITFSREIEDFDLSTDTADFPPEWAQALVWNLGVELSPFFDREDKATKFASKAAEIKFTLMNRDSESTSLKIR